MSAVVEHPKGSTKIRAQQILEAAEHLLAEEGYEGLTAQAVARRAGVNKALVFYYWSSTAQLFERVLERYYARHRQALVDALSVQGSPRERVHHIIDTYLDYMEANRRYVRLVQQQVAGRGPHLPAVQRHLAALMEVSMGLLGEFAPSQGPAAARHLHLSLSALVVNYFTYAPALGEAWGPDDPLSLAGLEERRAHVHWVVDAWLDRLHPKARSAPSRQG
ncbi:MAG: TetR/AcrR family transcriptional regulator [Myxococcota bacterium]